MGEEKEKDQKEKLFKGYQVNEELADFADKNYIFMHCLPARIKICLCDTWKPVWGNLDILKACGALDSGSNPGAGVIQ